MFVKCGNPACSRPFGISLGGAFFMSDSCDGVDSPRALHVELTTGRKVVYLFWVCDICSALIRFEADHQNFRSAERKSSGKNCRPNSSSVEAVSAA